MSYDPGEFVEFLGSTTSNSWSMTIYRDGHEPELAARANGLAGEFTPTSATCYMDGCDWPVLHRWQVPADARSGLYRTVCGCERRNGERIVEHPFIVVRPSDGAA